MKYQPPNGTCSSTGGVSLQAFCCAVEGTGRHGFLDGMGGPLETILVVGVDNDGDDDDHDHDHDHDDDGDANIG